MTGNRDMRRFSRTTRRISERQAVPEGGARSLHWCRVRDCILILLAVVSPLIARSQTVPSGQSVTLTEVLEDHVGGEDWLRMRFIAPHIARDGGGPDFAAVGADILHLCESVARPYLEEYKLAPSVVVISLMDRPVEFGVADPEATQLFEAFRIENDACVLEPF